MHAFSEWSLLGQSAEVFAKASLCFWMFQEVVADQDWSETHVYWPHSLIAQWVKFLPSHPTFAWAWSEKQNATNWQIGRNFNPRSALFDARGCGSNAKWQRGQLSAEAKTRVPKAAISLMSTKHWHQEAWSHWRHWKDPTVSILKCIFKMYAAFFFHTKHSWLRLRSSLFTELTDVSMFALNPVLAPAHVWRSHSRSVWWFLSSLWLFLTDKVGDEV